MPDLPSGTVTFLFTDIEGSTTRWEHQPEGMRTALARHDELVRAAIVEQGGHVVKTMGDAFLAVFVRAQDAVGAALDAQRRLKAESWIENDPLRVRMAVHTGAAEERDGDYYGPPLNRAARLMSAGHGGQVLLSQSTFALIRDTPPDGVTFIDLGEHRLKDLIRPERVFQVVAPDLASDFPPLASLDARPNNLPTHPTALLGRERELAEVRTLFEDGARLVTLTGPRGTGKTRLSLQVAAELLDSFEHGVFFVELAPVTDPGIVPTAIAQVLGIGEGGSRPILESVKSYLSSRSMLLVLDNFEQIVAAASVVADLLASNPGLEALVSSRESLQVRGEREYAVPPLALPADGGQTNADTWRSSAAVALFEERATAVRGGFAVTRENAAAVSEICRRLDGLPLAIELAAARVRLLTPQVMVRRLEQRLPLLTGGARDLPARHQTLRDTIAWSHDLLDDTERRLFHRLSVFVGGWTLDAAESVCNVDGNHDILEGLESLISKSLVKSGDGTDGEPRFWMLETIREFALERLAAHGNLEELRDRHAEWFKALVTEAEPGPEGGVWMDRLQADHDNLRAALAWCAASADPDRMGRLAGPLGWFWWIRGYFTEGRRWLDQALDRVSDPTTRIGVLQGAGVLAFFQDNLGRADAVLSEMAELSRAAGDHASLASALAWHGYVARQLGDYPRAEARCAEAVALSRQGAPGEPLVLALLMQAQVALGQADFARAVVLLEEGLRTARREEEAAAWMPYTLQNLARAFMGLGELDHALVLLEEARALFHQRRDSHGLENVDRIRLRIARVGGDVRQGAALIRENLIVNRDLGSGGNLASGFESAAWLARVNREYARSARLLGAADALRESLQMQIQAEVRRERDEDLAIVRDALGSDAFDAAWAEGRAMGLDGAVAYALESPTLT